MRCAGARPCGVQGRSRLQWDQACSLLGLQFSLLKTAFNFKFSCVNQRCKDYRHEQPNQGPPSIGQMVSEVESSRLDGGKARLCRPPIISPQKLLGFQSSPFIYQVKIYGAHSCGDSSQAAVSIPSPTRCSILPSSLFVTRLLTT